MRFLDPFTKSGVFLREITSRLAEGLGDEIPDLEERVDHILTKQVFGIGITYAHQPARAPERLLLEVGERPALDRQVVRTATRATSGSSAMEHTWVGGTEWVLTADENGNEIKKFTNGRCKYCGASQQTFDRGDGLETHAYAFIHTDDIKARIAELFGDDMQFDVIIGNPPYQLDDGGFGTSAAPIYHQFVEQAKKLDPRFLTMVIPSRWFAGGKGLDEFRESMLTDDRMRSIDDYLNASDVFPASGSKAASATSSGTATTPAPAASRHTSRTRRPQRPHARSSKRASTSSSASTKACRSSRRSWLSRAAAELTHSRCLKASASTG